MMLKMKFEDLNSMLKDEVKQTLRVFDKVHVIFENGEFKVSTGILLKNKYPLDYRFIGTYCKKDIYTLEEQIIIYIEEFVSFPIQYTGKKNWNMLQSMKDLNKEGKQARIILLDGNATIDRIETIETIEY